MPLHKRTPLLPKPFTWSQNLQIVGSLFIFFGFLFSFSLKQGLRLILPLQYKNEGYCFGKMRGNIASTVIAVFSAKATYSTTLVCTATSARKQKGGVGKGRN